MQFRYLIDFLKQYLIKLPFLFKLINSLVYYNDNDYFTKKETHVDLFTSIHYEQSLYRTKYSRMDQVKLIGYLVHSLIICLIYSAFEIHATYLRNHYV